MSEGLQDKQGSNKKFFKLQEDKRPNSKTLKQYRFFQQEKVNGSWTSTNEGNSMSGVLKSINIKTYQYEGQPKEQLEVELAGQESSYIISFGLQTLIAENLINSLASEPIIGTVEFNCGLPKNDYPTLYINHNGQKTNWKYNKEAGNWDEVPKVTTELIEGTKVKRGQLARTEFWKKVLNEQILPKLAPLSPQTTQKPEGIKTETSIDNSRNDQSSDLPF